MQLSLLFLIPDKLDHKIMFTCPTCSGQTFLPSTAQLGELHCSHCGDVHDAKAAELEVLIAEPKENRSRAGRHLRDLGIFH